MASKAKQEILKAAARLGLIVTETTWTPIGGASDFGGPSGGWFVLDSDGHDYLGYSFTEVIKDMENAVKWRMYGLEAERHFRRGLRAGAKEKDARIADLIALLPADTPLTPRAKVALREYRNAAFHRFIEALYRETNHQARLRVYKTAGYKSGDDGPIPPLEARDVWGAIESLMAAEFGERWRDA